MVVDWDGGFTGEPHKPVWTLACIVNGVEKGKGVGYSKQLAKEEAAKMAYIALGFDQGVGGNPGGNPHVQSQPEPRVYLAAFNEKAMQQRLKVDFIAESGGPSHMLRWYVKCLVNGELKASGQGNSKRAAKEAAAEDAYHAMGW
ncbi:hypothetical protein JAAARDRAFT_597138 [Jaapia argillacea MUCL 33604]|uniref:DRBM domain-containing protein n=1 Tax=Jaapia argillacea MUCL 33604 TaxID=933084 RepID=A0A067PZ99_9AGAM|nr:hypothetical protein JAAARDRAFT_597138 [Jaapia argillacea MUCL 33604]